MTAHVPPGGPYCDDELRRWWVAVEDCGYLEARRMVKGTAELDHWSRLSYEGRQMAYLWDGDEHTHDDDGEPDEDGFAGRCEEEGCRYVMAWAFEVVER